jgi:hypothetical protein
MANEANMSGIIYEDGQCCENGDVTAATYKVTNETCASAASSPCDRGE